MQTETIKVSQRTSMGEQSSREVVAEIHGLVAIHRTTREDWLYIYPGRWSLVHIPTGLGIVGRNSLPDARRLARLLGPLLPAGGEFGVSPDKEALAPVAGALRAYLDGHETHAPAVKAKRRSKQQPA